jgi:hypothetical protein
MIVCMLLAIGALGLDFEVCAAWEGVDASKISVP